MKEVIFDVETQKLFEELEDFDPGKLGVSVASAYIRELDSDFKEKSGQMISFWEEDLPKLWPYFQEADRIIGFNSIGFDTPVLQPYTQIPLSKLKHFDILAEVKSVLGHRLSLDALAIETLGSQKSDVGLNAVKYWKNGDPESLAKLQSYCEQDVLITRDLYDYALHKKILKFKDKWNTLREVKVDFSYQPEETSQQQIGLF